MLLLKIISLIFVFLLSLLQFRQEKTIIKRGGITLCAIVMVIGIADIIISDKEQDVLKSQILKDSTRITWSDTTFEILLMNEKDEVIDYAQQVLLKIIPADKGKIGKVNVEDILKTVERSDYGYKFISEESAEKLFYALAEDDGSILLKKEEENGIETIYFQKKKIKKDPFQGTIVSFELSYEPSVKSIYTSLYSLKDKILIARIVAKTKQNSFVGWAQLNMRTKAGPLILHFPPKQIVEGKVKTSPVRYVGLYLKDEFRGI